MRMILNVTLPPEVFNAYVKDGTAGIKLNKILEATKPEAVYFTAKCGQRSAILIVDLPDASKLPSLVEPWMLTFQSYIEISPVMSPEDLQKAGLEELGKKWG